MLGLWENLTQPWVIARWVWGVLPQRAEVSLPAVGVFRITNSAAVWLWPPLGWFSSWLQLCSVPLLHIPSLPSQFPTEAFPEAAEKVTLQLQFSGAHYRYVKYIN